MNGRKRRVAALAVLSSGLVLQDGCAIASAVLDTIALAFSIVDVWA